MTTETAQTVKLTRAEAAYAHLASFQRGDLVDVGGRRFFLPGTITTTQRPGATLEDAYVVVTGTASTNRTRQTVRVSDLMAGDRTIASLDDAKAGRTQYFDAATWAMQNPEA